MGLIGKEQATKQLAELRTNDSQHLETIIMLAAGGGDVELFHDVLRPLLQLLTEKQVGRVKKAGLSVDVMARVVRGRLNSM